MSAHIISLVYFAGTQGLFVLDWERIANGRLCGNHNETTGTPRASGTESSAGSCEPGGLKVLSAPESSR
jgi:hypothetical protein